MSHVKHLFSTFDVTRQVFYKSHLSLGIVNLKPLLPGHVLVLPRRVVPRLADLSHGEITDLFVSVQQIGKIIEKTFSAEALTVSLQDGVVAGQSVPHVHVHILPRRSTDFGGVNDKIYPALEASEQALSRDLNLSEVQEVEAQVNGENAHSRSGDGARSKAGARTPIEVPPDEDRKPRSMEEMEQEARWLESQFDVDAEP